MANVLLGARQWQYPPGGFRRVKDGAAGGMVEQSSLVEPMSQFGGKADRQAHLPGDDEQQRSGV